MRSRSRLMPFVFLCCLALMHAPERRAQAITIEPWPVDPGFANAWPADWERGFAQRSQRVVELTAREGRYGNTFFENEKRSYAIAMLSILGGYEEQGVAFLQERDNPGEWSTHTEGIDFYACFTLKHQVRKFFYFGQLLDNDYLQRMRRGAATWTERDPLGRPHHAFAGNQGWGPDARNSWVDIRNTDNLKLMRDTSVYLFAEVAGNEEVRELYKQRLEDFIVSLFYVGMGEFDSENYLGHSIAPLLNLYDFAEDAEVRRLAKAGLDFMAASLAVKYFRGGYNGPSRRDYNHPYPLGGSAAFVGWLWFGDMSHGPTDAGQVEMDSIHVITSGYRPPAAVVELARRNFDRPLQITAGKGRWEAWRDLQTDRPTYYETQYFSDHYQFGTLARGTQHPDINGFKALVEHDRRGADTIVAGPVSDPLRLGSSQYDDSLLAHHSAVGQNGNFAIYLTAAADHPYLWLIPDDARVSTRGSAVIVRCQRVSMAIWPINLGAPEADAALTRRVQVREREDRRTGEVTEEPRWVNSRVLSAQREGEGVYGFAVEFYDGDDHDGFARSAAALSPETDERLVRGAVAMTGVSGSRVRLQWGNTLDAIGIWCNGRHRDWSDDANLALFHTQGGELVDLPWQGDGTLRVNAGGQSFTCTVSREGEVVFESR